jgi:hypothetical protein
MKRNWLFRVPPESCRFTIPISPRSILSPPTRRSRISLSRAVFQHRLRRHLTSPAVT